MLAHQLAAVHKLAMEQMGHVSHERDAPAETNRVNAPTLPPVCIDGQGNESGELPCCDD